LIYRALSQNMLLHIVKQRVNIVYVHVLGFDV